jgi:hypothetical protein
MTLCRRHERVRAGAVTPVFLAHMLQYLKNETG